MIEIDGRNSLIGCGGERGSESVGVIEFLGGQQVAAGQIAFVQPQGNRRHLQYRLIDRRGGHTGPWAPVGATIRLDYRRGDRGFLASSRQHHRVCQRRAAGVLLHGPPRVRPAAARPLRQLLGVG